MIHTFKENKVVFLISLICFSYWLYLFCYSSMIVSCDAIGYQDLGETIYKKGWAQFFRTGPNREPLYPLSIAISMQLADFFKVSYLKIQTILQILVLFSVQVLAFHIMTMCSFKKWVKSAAVFYIGFSPAITNSGFSLYSEILAMPFVLLIVISSARFLKKVQTEYTKSIALSAVGMSLSFIGAISVKAAFIYIFYCFISLFFVGALWALLHKQIGIMKRIICGILVMICLVGGFVCGYKYTNKIYNGKFDFTNRYDVLLFGTAYKRTQPLSQEIWIAHFASILGTRFCDAVVNREACLYPQFFYGDAIWPKILPPLLIDVPPGKTAARTVQLSLEQIKQNPIQYLFLTWLESLKMGFWESTQLAFVKYPQPLSNLFENTLFKNAIRLIISLMTFAGQFAVFQSVWKSRNKIAKPDEIHEPAHILFFISLTILLFATSYSFFAVLTRFALPVAPLYVICIAYWLGKIDIRKSFFDNAVS